MAVLFLDVDRFRHVNDSLGHEIGDRLLQSVAQRLLDCVRRPDTVGTVGQGFYLSEPLTAAEFTRLCRRKETAIAGSMV